MPNDSCIDAQPLSSADTGDHGMQLKPAEEAGNLHASREYRFAAILNFIPNAYRDSLPCSASPEAINGAAQCYP